MAIAEEKRISIQPVLVVLFIVQISIVGSFIGWLSLRNGQQSVKDLVNTLLNEVTSRIHENLSTFLSVPQNVNKLNLDAIRSAHINVEDFSSLKSSAWDLEYYLWQQLHNYPQVNYVYMANEHGDFIGVVRRLREGRFKYFTEVRDRSTRGLLLTYELNSGAGRMRMTQTGKYEPRKRPWYIKAKSSAGAAWSDVYAFFLKPELGLTAIRRINDHANVVRGVMASDIKLSNFSKYMGTLKIGKRGRAFIIERDGMLVATSSPEGLARKRKDGKLDRIDATTSIDPMIRSTALGIRDKFGTFKGIDKVYQLSYQYHGQSNLMQVTPLTQELKLDWLIVVVVPEEDFMEHINANTRWTILFCFIALVVSTILSTWLTQRITKPLQNLAKHTQELVLQDFKAPPEVKAGIELMSTSRWDEVGNLAGSFLFMEQELQNYIVKIKETTAAKERIESELRVAREIQMSVLPQEFPPFPDHTEFEIHAHIEPAKEMSGDFYDFYMIDDDHLYFTIGDVSGKGVPASLFMVTTRTLLEASAHELSEPDLIQNKVNIEVSRKNEAMMFVTVFYCILNIRSGELHFANAGHNLPYLVRQDGGVEFLGKTGEPALGVMEDMEYELERTVLEPGDCLFLYTDGVTEAMSAEGKEYSEPKLEECLRRVHDSPVREMIREVVADVKTFTVGAPQSDDITAVAVRYHGVVQRERESEGSADRQAVESAV